MGMKKMGCMGTIRGRREGRKNGKTYGEENGTVKGKGRMEGDGGIL